MNKWISVNEQLPAVAEDYMAFTHSKEVLFTNGKRIFLGYCQQWEEDEYPLQWKVQGPDGYEIDNVTHWMALPTNKIRIAESAASEQERILARTMPEQYEIVPDEMKRPKVEELRKHWEDSELTAVDETVKSLCDYILFLERNMAKKAVEGFRKLK